MIINANGPEPLKPKNLSNYQKKQPAIDICLFDDAAYSGKQMADIVYSAADSARSQGFSVANIYVVLACATRFAKERIMASLEKEGKANGTAVRIVGKPILMPTLADLKRQGKFTESEWKSLLKHWMLQPNVMRKQFPVETLTLTYLAHKLPDEVSSFEPAIRTGELIGAPALNGVLRQDLPFLPRTVPNYKK